MTELSTGQILEDMHGWSQLVAKFEGIIGDIDARIAALTSSLSVKVYVNEPLGLDTAAGTEAAPVKTLEEAIARVPAGAFGTIVFKTSMTLTKRINTRAQGLLFEAYPTVSPAFKSGWYVGEDGLLYPGQINFAGSYGSVGFNGVGMHFEAMPSGTRGDAYASGVFVTNSLTPPLFCGLFECAITRTAGAEAFLIAAASDTSTLNVATSVTYSAAMNGYWFSGVASGTSSTATRHNTDVTSL